MADDSSSLREALHRIRFHMNAVSEYAALCNEFKILIDFEVITGVREELLDPEQLAKIFRVMCLKIGVRMLCMQFAQSLHEFRRAGRRKTRRQGQGQPLIKTVPALQ